MNYLRAEQLPGALVKGDIDAFSMREPYIGMAADLLGENAVRFSERGLYLSHKLLVAKSAFAQQHPDAVTALLRALIRAEEVLRTSPDRAFEYVVKRLGASPGQMREIWPSLTPEVAFGQALLLNLEEIANGAIGQGIVSARDKPDYQDLLSPGFLERADAERVTLIK